MNKRGKKLSKKYSSAIVELEDLLSSHDNAIQRGHSALNEQKEENQRLLQQTKKLIKKNEKLSSQCRQMELQNQNQTENINKLNETVLALQQQVDEHQATENEHAKQLKQITKKVMAQSHHNEAVLNESRILIQRKEEKLQESAKQIELMELQMKKEKQKMDGHSNKIKKHINRTMQLKLSMSEKDHRIKNLEKELSQSNERLDLIKRENDELEQKLIDLESKVEIMGELEQKNRSSSRSLANIQNRMTKYVASVKNLKESEMSYQAQLEDREQVIRELTENLNAANAENDKIRHQCDEMHMVINRHRKNEEKEIERYENMINVIRSRKSSVQL